MRRDSFLVTDDGSTPDRPLAECFYCKAPVDTEHQDGCVMRRRTVVLRATVAFVAVVPESFDPGSVHFFYNEGRWCADNLPQLLEDHIGDDDEHGCLCGSTTITFVREATEQDEERSALKVADLID